MNCSHGCAWSKVPEAADPWKSQREPVWDLGDASANQAVFCPLLSPTASTGSLSTSTRWRWDRQARCSQCHPSGILPMPSPEPPVSCRNLGCKANRKCCCAAWILPLQLKCKPRTIWPWVCRMWWESRGSRRLHVTFPQWDDRSLICCRPHQQLQPQTLPVWDANPCPGRLWKMMGCSREEPDLCYKKYYPWTVTMHEIAKIFNNRGKK